jgi:dTDP-4-amino-4,6-dideoxygalactose transaminase
MILKEPSDPSRYSAPRYFSSAARIGFRHLLRHLQYQQGARILLPSYIGYSHREGSGVLDPIEDLKIPFDFYRVDSDLSADLADIERLILHSRVSMVVVIHYFGFPQPETDIIKRICSAHGIYLLEDCAHCTYSPGASCGPGWQGDFSLFSMHKTLPVRDGGILRINNRNLPLPPLDQQDRITPESLAVILNANIDQISKARISNYNLLLSLLPPSPEYKVLFPSINPGVVPLNLPLLINKRDRLWVHQALLDLEIQTTALYYKLVDRISVSLFPESHAVSQKILNLPIHQDLEADDLSKMAASLTSVLARGPLRTV